MLGNAMVPASYVDEPHDEHEQLCSCFTCSCFKVALVNLLVDRSGGRNLQLALEAGGVFWWDLTIECSFIDKSRCLC